MDASAGLPTAHPRREEDEFHIADDEAVAAVAVDEDDDDFDVSDGRTPTHDEGRSAPEDVPDRQNSQIEIIREHAARVLLDYFRYVVPAAKECQRRRSIRYHDVERDLLDERRMFAANSLSHFCRFVNARAEVRNRGLDVDYFRTVGEWLDSWRELLLVQQLAAKVLPLQATIPEVASPASDIPDGATAAVSTGGGSDPTVASPSFGAVVAASPQPPAFVAPSVVIVMGVSGSGKSTIASNAVRSMLDSQRQSSASLRAAEDANPLLPPVHQRVPPVDCVVVDADDFHTEACKLQMQAGQGLTDAQRLSWLDRLLTEVVVPTIKHNRQVALDRESQDEEGGTARPVPRLVLLACSALKHRYRKELLKVDGRDVWLAYLRVSPELARSRISGRRRDGGHGGHVTHFATNPALVDSQFRDLEEPVTMAEGLSEWCGDQDTFFDTEGNAQSPVKPQLSPSTSARRRDGERGLVASLDASAPTDVVVSHLFEALSRRAHEFLVRGTTGNSSGGSRPASATVAPKMLHKEVVPPPRDDAALARLPSDDDAAQRDDAARKIQQLCHRRSCARRSRAPHAPSQEVVATPPPDAGGDASPPPTVAPPEERPADVDGRLPQYSTHRDPPPPEPPAPMSQGCFYPHPQGEAQQQSADSEQFVSLVQRLSAAEKASWQQVVNSDWVNSDFLTRRLEEMLLRGATAPSLSPAARNFATDESTSSKRTDHHRGVSAIVIQESVKDANRRFEHPYGLPVGDFSTEFDILARQERAHRDDVMLQFLRCLIDHGCVSQLQLTRRKQHPASSLVMRDGAEGVDYFSDEEIAVSTLYAGPWRAVRLMALHSVEHRLQSDLFRREHWEFLSLASHSCTENEHATRASIADREAALFAQMKRDADPERQAAVNRQRIRSGQSRGAESHDHFVKKLYCFRERVAEPVVTTATRRVASAASARATPSLGTMPTPPPSNHGEATPSHFPRSATDVSPPYRLSMSTREATSHSAGGLDEGRPGTVSYVPTAADAARRRNTCYGKFSAVARRETCLADDPTSEPLSLVASASKYFSLVPSTGDDLPSQRAPPTARTGNLEPQRPATAPAMTVNPRAATAAQNTVVGSASRLDGRPAFRRAMEVASSVYGFPISVDLLNDVVHWTAKQALLKVDFPAVFVGVAQSPHDPSHPAMAAAAAKRPQDDELLLHEMHRAIEAQADHSSHVRHASSTATASNSGRIRCGDVDVLRAACTLVPQLEQLDADVWREAAILTSQMWTLAYPRVDPVSDSPLDALYQCLFKRGKCVLDLSLTTTTTTPTADSNLTSQSTTVATLPTDSVAHVIIALLAERCRSLIAFVSQVPGYRCLYQIYRLFVQPRHVERDDTSPPLNEAVANAGIVPSGDMAGTMRWAVQRFQRMSAPSTGHVTGAKLMLQRASLLAEQFDVAAARDRAAFAAAVAPPQEASSAGAKPAAAIPFDDWACDGRPVVTKRFAVTLTSRTAAFDAAVRTPAYLNAMLTSLPSCDFLRICIAARDSTASATISAVPMPFKPSRDDGAATSLSSPAAASSISGSCGRSFESEFDVADFIVTNIFFETCVAATAAESFERQDAPLPVPFRHSLRSRAPHHYFQARQSFLQFFKVPIGHTFDQTGRPTTSPTRRARVPTPAGGVTTSVRKASRGAADITPAASPSTGSAPASLSVVVPFAGARITDLSALTNLASDQHPSVLYMANCLLDALDLPSSSPNAFLSLQDVLLLYGGQCVAAKLAQYRSPDVFILSLHPMLARELASHLRKDTQSPTRSADVGGAAVEDKGGEAGGLSDGDLALGACALLGDGFGDLIRTMTTCATTLHHVSPTSIDFH